MSRTRSFNYENNYMSERFFYVNSQCEKGEFVFISKIHLLCSFR